MTRFLMDTGIASDYLNQRHGVYDRARTEVSRGNPMGIGVPVLAELVSGIERSHFILFGIANRQHNDSDVGVLPDGSARREPTHARHGHI